MTISEIKGVYCAMMTPFDDDGKISERQAEAFMDFYVEKGLDGVFAVSNVGEFACLSLEEKKYLTELCGEKGRDRLLVCPGVSDFRLDNCLALADHAKDSGAAAVVLSSPIYYPYPGAYVEEFVRLFLRDTPLPVIFYHSPKFACSISMEFLLEVMAHPHTAAIKESSGDVRFLLTLLNRCRARGIDTPVMLGWEELCLTGLTYGAKGTITSCGGVVPELLRGITDSFHAGDQARAALLQQAVSRITDVLSGYGFPQGYKLGMAARGFPFRIHQSPRMEKLERGLQGEVAAVKAMLDKELAVLSQHQN